MTPAGHKRRLVATVITGWSGGVRLDCIEIAPRGRRSIRAEMKLMRRRLPHPYRVTRFNVFEYVRPRHDPC